MIVDELVAAATVVPLWAWLAFYVGGVLAAGTRWLNTWLLSFTHGQRQRHRKLGDPRRTLVVQAVLWPFVAVATVVIWLATVYARRRA